MVESSLATKMSVFGGKFVAMADVYAIFDKKVQIKIIIICSKGPHELRKK